MSQIEGARLFREAWIAGVRQHFPGDADIFEAVEKAAS